MRKRERDILSLIYFHETYVYLEVNNFAETLPQYTVKLLIRVINGSLAASNNVAYGNLKIMKNVEYFKSKYSPANVNFIRSRNLRIYVKSE